ncbi:uncharacterized protein LOC141631640 [Silene latifolia]|uniref:uncharacterized protein LOC141631640 n=1 Tax=Silene latifolia TaxID=37657 RepID=UPI003D786741
MRWHYENPRANGIMSHPSDGEAWKHFDKQNPDFASKPRNVRLGLCTDGFSAFNQFGRSYSCWPVMLTPYNLPPWLCMKKQFIFLSLIIPGPKNPKKNIDVYLQPLIQKLKDLWENGLFTYDVSRKQNFNMRAALLWTINDFPAYGMLSGRTTAGQHAYNKHFRKDRPVEADIASTRLTHDEVWEHVQYLHSIVDATDEELLKLKKKREGWWKRSIFWDLPFWKTLLIRHNLDVMHIEKNFFEQLIHTIMDEKNKTSFKPNAQKDLKIVCKSQWKGDMFVLKKEQKRVLCNWICNLKFSDGYASDLSRCVDLKDLRLHGMKSHDCHVFMERLLPVALKHLLPKNEWFLNHLKRKIGNKARVEGSICNAYLLEKISNFCSLYFEKPIDTKAKQLNVCVEHQTDLDLPELFQDHMGKTSGKCQIRKFEEFISKQHPHLFVDDMRNKFEKESAQWLRNQVNDDDTMTDDLIIALAMGPSREVRTWKCYFINGYNFRAFKDGKDVAKSTLKIGVYVNSTEGADY